MWFSRLFEKRKVEQAPPGALQRAVVAADYDGIESAIRDGDDIDAYDALGMTPLLAAVFRGDLRAVNQLLAAGADPNRAQAGDPTATPLWHAAEDFGLTEIAEAIRHAGGKLK